MASWDALISFWQKSEGILKTETVYDQDGMCEQIQHIPLGLIGNISAWNYPWFVGGNVFVPGLLMGNAVVYKPSEYAAMTGLEMARLLHGAGAPTFDDGKPGDFYIDTTRSWLYGPKTGTGWGSAVKLKPDPATMTLPTGFKAQQGDPIYPRVFAGAMAGGGGGGTVMIGGGSGDGNLSPILGNNAPLAAGTPLVVASDPVGDAMIVDLWALGPNGTLFVEVGVSKGTGTEHGLQRGV